MTIKDSEEPTVKESATSKTTKRMLSSFLEHAAYWTGVAAVAFTAAAAVAGSLAWYFSTKLSDIKKAEFDTFRESSRKSISEAQARSAEANKTAAEANERAAVLEKQAAEARLELAKIDPINLPIRSIRADVWLVVRAIFFDWYFDKNSPILKGGAAAANVTLAGKELALVTLRQCIEFESNIWKEEGQPDGRTFQMSFFWPAGDWFSAQDVKYWIERNNASTAMLDKELIGMLISLPPTKEEKPVQILQSSCHVTINGMIRRDFSVPKSSSKSEIFCPIKTN